MPSNCVSQFSYNSYIIWLSCRSACVFFKIPVKNKKSTVTPFSVLMRFGTAGLMIWLGLHPSVGYKENPI